MFSHVHAKMHLDAPSVAHPTDMYSLLFFLSTFSQKRKRKRKIFESANLALFPHAGIFRGKSLCGQTFRSPAGNSIFPVYSKSVSPRMPSGRPQSSENILLKDSRISASFIVMSNAVVL